MFEAVYSRLLAAIEAIPVIDAHEHLPPERVRLETEVDALTFFSHYTKNDLLRSGLSQADYASLYDPDLPLQERWAKVAPYWENSKFTSYGRSVRLSAKRFYDCEEINADTVEELSAKMKAFNKPGIYDRVLRDVCNIRACLTQFRGMDVDHELLIPIMPGMIDADSMACFRDNIFAPDRDLNSIDESLDAMRAYIKRIKTEGAVGIKISAYTFGEPDRKVAEEVFNDLKRGTLKAVPARDKNGKPIANPLQNFLLDETIREATALDLVVAVHPGYWQDFRELDPLNLIPLLQRHREARFDVYHLGYPWVRETLMLGKGFDNVWINLCWLYIISSTCATAALDEAIDLLPRNKVIGFGGDYRIPVEKVYGHLTMARDAMANVLARRVVSGHFDEGAALEMARHWLWDSPVSLYDLGSRVSK